MLILLAYEFKLDPNIVEAARSVIKAFGDDTIKEKNI